MSLKKLFGSSICTAVLCATVSAQETKPNQLPQQTIANGANKMGAQAMVTVQQLAECWALDNQQEVIFAKFGQEKSKNKEVSSFAKMIAEEHQACLKKISKFAPEAMREGLLVEKQADQSRSRNESTSDSIGSNNQNPTATVNATLGIDMIQLHREVAQQCIFDSKKYLNAKNGDEFDKCFVGMQIARHAAMHTKLVVLQRHTFGEMKQMVAEGIEVTDKHMKAAESLMAKLDKADETASTKSGK